MKLTYGQLELTLAAHLQVHPDKLPTLRSRMKQLQRLQFPPGVNVGRGTKMEYTGEHLFQLVTAFELIAFGLPAQAACNLVLEHWKLFAAGYALAALQGRDFNWTDEVPVEDKGEQILAILWMQSLHEIQFGMHVAPKPSELKICDELVARGELRPYDFHRHFTRLIISLGALLTRVLKIASERAGVRATVWDEDFHAWLPKGEEHSVNLGNPYPDRSNIAQRRYLNQWHGNDRESLTPDGAEEAQDFLANNYSKKAPF